jgi:hypothetical protein
MLVMDPRVIRDTSLLRDGPELLAPRSERVVVAMLMRAREGVKPISRLRGAM